MSAPLHPCGCDCGRCLPPALRRRRRTQLRLAIAAPLILAALAATFTAMTAGVAIAALAVLVVATLVLPVELG